jgi:hypothetical protein
MKKVIVNGRHGITTSIIPHRDDKFPVWYDNLFEFVDASKVSFDDGNKVRPTPPPDRIEWIPGIFGLRFSKWLDKKRNA